MMGRLCLQPPLLLLSYYIGFLVPLLITIRLQ